MSVSIVTSLGRLKVELECDKVPKLCYNFLALAGSGYYDGLTFHRNLAEFMVQGGDPYVAARETEDGIEYYKGTNGPKGGESIWGANFDDHFHQELKHHERGVLSMANKGANTNASQFFITYGPQSHLDNVYCAFGKVVDGFEVLDAMEKVKVGKKNRPVDPIVIKTMLIHANPLADQGLTI
uniref:Peptidyl-prolyl cis-trans isomerase n=1 Tax=Mucochytrium quahogii TaxID=96639 RepID=A0A7S2S1T3_9STRA|mmetsp:Transcript_12019/g.19561  ORF Transcript_12019/g.19561 Transcript_12019/m.19561 type:complete len:182 (-) Transcript_12019:164-709(-)|eukprot:CAMPEP_0203775202 /NCGR_PEP_ID=MMETSP0099_2-20121227/5908_1 /ASSEMBLY_ACC=CAM_ASM_000209 /TAXON_ID=96639 /ORGANISM=" , Strain NY0313808BC1" /LENGTH=181 /DNA_ID=CAMNT_0050673769 /DNA_START=46 /DNA_END=591 /DNA_ORIENTATION=-